MNENKKIAFNTTILYIKLIFSVLIGLYASRIILLALGATDYGLYAVVGGIVSLMNFFGTTMLSTSYRFLAIEMGKGDQGDLNKIYNTVFIIHLALALFLLLIGETLGPWYIKNYLNVDQSRISDALYVLHWSLAACAFSVIAVPSNGLLIAREKFLFTSICEIGRMIFKLCLVIALAHYCGNRLRLFAIIMCIFNLIVPVCNTIYCWLKETSIVQFHINHNKEDYKKILSYCGWIMLGSAAYMGQSQGSSIIINLFFNTVMNAAYSIATQVNGYIQMLVRSLSQATVPQILKNYSGGNKERSFQLVFIICRYSFFIMILPSATLIISLNEILTIWLKNPPEYTSGFIFFMLINAMVYTLECGFDTMIQATGKIRNNQIGISLILFTLLPIAYVLYSHNASVFSITIVNIVLSICIILFHCYILKKQTSFSYLAYLKNTIIPAIKIVSMVSVISILLRNGFIIENLILSIIIKSTIAIMLISLTIYYLGLNKSERQYIITAIKTLNNKIKKNLYKH